MQRQQDKESTGGIFKAPPGLPMRLSPLSLRVTTDNKTEGLVRVEPEARLTENLIGLKDTYLPTQMTPDRIRSSPHLGSSHVAGSRARATAPNRTFDSRYDKFKHRRNSSRGLKGGFGYDGE
ncbi:hypothetical protein EYC84_003788 [Monilinia fructicola]|uniref:Uncharacterized protein n=1 Tax=Monilinia fructicola TaxID=38448 RepID=A0A5M9JXE3_MONFR|nr:hypothetical protein EYC84_003788 [Monilinia fructicola]